MQPEFKVGDRVQIIGCKACANPIYPPASFIGQEGTVVRSSATNYYVKFSICDAWWYESTDLAPSGPPILLDLQEALNA